MFKSPFFFTGRIRRLEFGLSYIIYMAFNLLFQIVLESYKEFSLLVLILGIPAFWFLIAQGSKRCHDRGNSGWYQIIPFYLLWMIFADSEEGENEFGLNPKGFGNNSEIEEIGKNEN